MRTLLKAPYRGPISAVILDWSGTVVDPYVLAPAVAFVKVFNKWGVHLSMAEARGPMGLRKDVHIAKLLGVPEIRRRFKTAPTSETAARMFEDFVPIQKGLLKEYSTLITGVKEVVDVLRSSEYNHIKIGMTTGFAREMVEVLKCHAKEQGFVPDFDAAGDDLDGEQGVRPSPFMIYQNLTNLGVYPIQSVVKVDDTVAGCGEGEAAGAWTVAISDYSTYMNVSSVENYRNLTDREQEDRKLESRHKLMQESNAHYIIDDIYELPKCVSHINARMARGEQP